MNLNSPKKIITLGEIMLRLSTPGFKRFVQSNSFDVHYGGGEANVALSLAQFGHQTAFISKLPNNSLGQSAVNHLRTFGVNTDYIKREGDRIGIYFLETGASMRASQVIYDRAHSAISEATIDDFDFDSIFDGYDWFHFSGITPALSDNAAKITKQALISAKSKGLTISVDLNFRKKLWSSEKAIRIMTPLMQWVDICIGNEEDTEKVLGFKPENSDINDGKLDLESYHSIFKKMKECFCFKMIATTLRESYSASDNGWSALLYDGNNFFKANHYNIHLVDRVGAGDSFCAALIHGLLTFTDKQKVINFATAASALKQTIPGDVNLISTQEIINLMENGGSGRIQR